MRYRCRHGRLCEVPADCPECAGVTRRGVRPWGRVVSGAVALIGAAAVAYLALAPHGDAGIDGAPPGPDDWLRARAPSREARDLTWTRDDRTGLEWLSTEVTVAQYAPCVLAGQCRTPTGGGFCPRLDGPPNQPVACIVSEDARRFCAWLGARVPTAEEWRSWVRPADAPAYPWGGEAPSCARLVARTGTCASAGPEEVCSRSSGRSAAGACDQLGNVAEWVAGASVAFALGGSYGTVSVDYLTSTVAAAADPDYRADDVGVRCVRDVGAGVAPSPRASTRAPDRGG